jgi:hypothetical protein
MAEIIDLASYRWLAVGGEAAGIVERMTIARRRWDTRRKEEPAHQSALANSPNISRALSE